MPARYPVKIVQEKASDVIFEAKLIRISHGKLGIQIPVEVEDCLSADRVFRFHITEIIDEVLT